MLPLSFLTRFITRAIFHKNVPDTDAAEVDMDIGYGAVVRHDGEHGHADEVTEPAELGSKQRVLGETSGGKGGTGQSGIIKTGVTNGANGATAQ